jgi:hypothetical protein
MAVDIFGLPAETAGGSSAGAVKTPVAPKTDIFGLPPEAPSTDIFGLPAETSSPSPSPAPPIAPRGIIATPSAIAPPTSAIRRVGDLGVAAIKGAVALPQGVLGIADTFVGGRIGKAVEDYTPVQFKETQDILSGLYSPAAKEAQARVSAAPGFIPKVVESVKNPSTIVNSVIESTPSMIGGGGIARGALKFIPGLARLAKAGTAVGATEKALAGAQKASIAAGAIGEMAITAGQNVEQVREQTPGGILTPKSTAVVAGSGALTGLISVFGGKLAQRLKVADVDTMMAGGAGAKLKIANVIKGFVSEGLFEELPQSMQEQAAQNVALGKPWDEGLADSAAQGLLAGGVMGAGANIVSRPTAKSKADALKGKPAILPPGVQADLPAEVPEPTPPLTDAEIAEINANPDIIAQLQEVQNRNAQAEPKDRLDLTDASRILLDQAREAKAAQDQAESARVSGIRKADAESESAGQELEAQQLKYPDVTPQIRDPRFIEYTRAGYPRAEAIRLVAEDQAADAAKTPRFEDTKPMPAPEAKQPAQAIEPPKQPISQPVAVTGPSPAVSSTDSAARAGNSSLKVGDQLEGETIDEVVKEDGRVTYKLEGGKTIERMISKPLTAEPQKPVAPVKAGEAVISQSYSISDAEALIKEAEPYRVTGEGYDRNIASAAQRLINMLRGGRSQSEINTFANELEIRLKAVRQPVKTAISSPEPVAPIQPQAPSKQTEAEAGSPVSAIEQTDESGAKFVDHVTPSGRKTIKFVATTKGHRAGDKYDAGMAVKVVTFEPDKGDSAPRGDGTDVEYISEIVEKDSIIVGKRRATDAELKAKRERFEREQDEFGVDAVDEREAKELGYVRHGDRYVFSPKPSTVTATQSPPAPEAVRGQTETVKGGDTSIPKDVAESFDYLRNKGVMRDTSAIDGRLSGVLGPDRSTRSHINTIVSAIDDGSISLDQVPKDLVDWLYNYTGAKDVADKGRLDARFAQPPTGTEKIREKLKGEKSEAQPEDSPKRAPTVSETAWRKAYDKEPDPNQRNDLLRRVAGAGRKATDDDLKEVLNLIEEDKVGSNAWNTAWDVAQNPMASAETKARALAMREEWMRPGRMEEETPASPNLAALREKINETKGENDTENVEHALRLVKGFLYSKNIRSGFYLPNNNVIVETIIRKYKDGMARKIGVETDDNANWEKIWGPLQDYLGKPRDPSGSATAIEITEAALKVKSNAIGTPAQPAPARPVSKTEQLRGKGRSADIPAEAVQLEPTQDTFLMGSRNHVWDAKGNKYYVSNHRWTPPSEGVVGFEDKPGVLHYIIRKIKPDGSHGPDIDADLSKMALYGESNESIKARAMKEKADDDRRRLEKSKPPAPSSLPDQLNAGTAVKPRDATYVRVNGSQVISAADVDTLKGAGPFKSAEWGIKGRSGFVAMGSSKAEALKGKAKVVEGPMVKREEPEAEPTPQEALAEYRRLMKEDSDLIREDSDLVPGLREKDSPSKAGRERYAKVTVRMQAIRDRRAEIEKRRLEIQSIARKVPEVKPPAPIKVTTDAQGDTTVSVPAADKPGLAPKEQKKYLLAEIDKAITEAPEDDSGGKVTISVPNDGEFVLLNSKATLEKFKKTVQAGFPAAIPGLDVPSRSNAADSAHDAAMKAISIYGTAQTARDTVARQIESLESDKSYSKDDIDRYRKTLKSLEAIVTEQEDALKRDWQAAWVDSQRDAAKKEYAKKVKAERDPMAIERNSIEDQAKIEWKSKRPSAPVPYGGKMLFSIPTKVMKDLKAQHAAIEAKAEKWNEENPNPTTPGWGEMMAEKAPAIPEGWKKGDAVPAVEKPAPKSEALKGGKKRAGTEKVEPKEDTGASGIEAGEELKANRRGKMTKRGWQDFENLNPALKAREVQKNNVWPSPDYQDMIDNGALATDIPKLRGILAHIAKQVRDAVGAKPSTRGAPTDADFKRYVEGVQRVEAGLAAWLKDKDAIAAVIKKAMKYAGALTGTPTDISEFAYKGPQKTLIDHIYPEGWRDYRDELITLGGNRLLRRLDPGYDEIKKAMAENEAGWPAKREAWQVQGYSVAPADVKVREQPQGGDRETIYFVEAGPDRRSVGYSRDRAEADAIAAKVKPFGLFKGSRLVDSFDTEEAAIEGARDKVKRDKGTTISDKGISVENAERTGADRRMEGEDITAQRMIDEFGFKGVNFGNWMKTPAAKAEAQLHLNHAFDAMHDLADLLGVPPKAMSLNGMLGLAIGAQGHGGNAAAHFVPGVNEINLTRLSGAGSLGHEWAHAVDHYFAVMAGKATSGEPFLTEHAGMSKEMAGLREEIRTAFKTIVDTMNLRKETQAEVDLRNKARTSRNGVQVGKWLESIKRSMFTDQAEAFDKLAERVKAGDYGDGKIAIGNAPTRRNQFQSYLSPVVDEMRQLYKAKNGRMPSPDDFKALQSWIDSADYAKTHADESKRHEPQSVTTEYRKAASALDKEKGGKRYWSTSLEMFARAFDAYVSDQLESRAAKNTYLSHQGRSGDTVPSGEERKAINAAFDTLVKEIKTRPTDKGVAMYSKKQGEKYERNTETQQRENNIPQREFIYSEARAGWERRLSAIQRKDPRFNERISDSVGRSQWFQDAWRIAKDAGVEVIPVVSIEDNPDNLAVYLGGEDVIMLSEQPEAKDQIWHEILHAKKAKGDTDAIALIAQVDRSSPAFISYRNQWMQDADMRAVAEDYVRRGRGAAEDLMAEELAATFNSGVNAVAVVFKSDKTAMELRGKIRGETVRQSRSTATITMTPADVRMAIRDLEEQHGVKATINPEGVNAGEQQGDRITLNANRITDADHARRVYREELVHMGIRSMTADEWRQLMDSAFNLKRADYRAMVDKVREQYPEYAEGSPEFREEVIAHIGQISDKPGLWDRFVAAVRKFLRARGWVKDMTDNDVDAMVREALGNVKAGGTEARSSRVDRVKVVTPEQDAAYLAAVSRGDTAEAQRMVDEVRKTSNKLNIKAPSLLVKDIERIARDSDDMGYVLSKKEKMLAVSDTVAYLKSKGVKSIDLYHVTDFKDPTASGISGYEISEIGDLKGQLRPKGVYAFLDPDDIDFGWNYISGTRDFKNTVVHFKIPIDEMHRLHWDSNFNVTSGAYSGVSVDGDIATESIDGRYKYMSPFLNPITRDDQGRVIPLSERFNEASNDIRYSRGEPTDARTEAEQRLINLLGLATDNREMGRDDIRGEVKTKMEALRAKYKAQTEARLKAAQGRYSDRTEALRGKLKGEKVEAVKEAKEDAKERLSDAILAERWWGKEALADQSAKYEGMADKIDASIREQIAAELAKAGADKAATSVTAGRVSIRAAIARLSDAANKAGGKATSADLKRVRREIYDAVKDALPRREWYRMLPAVVHARNQASVLAAVKKIDDIADEIERKELSALILKTYSKIMDSPSIKVEFRNMAKDFLDKIQLKAPSASKLESLKALDEYVNLAKANGIDAGIPRFLAEKLRHLNDKPLSEMTTEELSKTAETLLVIADAGKRQFITDKALWDARKSDVLDRLEAGTTPISTRGKGAPLPDDVDSMASALSDRIDRAKNGLDKFKLWSAPVMVALDTLDNRSGYNGANFKAFGASMSPHLNSWIKEKHLTFDGMDKVKKDNKIGNKEAVRIGIHAISIQQLPGDPAYGRKKLYNTYNAVTNEEKAKIDALVDGIKLTPEEQRFYDWMNKTLDDMWPRINDYTKRVWNFEIDKNDFYFPMITDWSIDENTALFGTEVVEVDSTTGLMANPDTGNRTTKTVKQNFAEKRKGAGDQKVQVDAIKVMQKHMDDALYAIHMGEAVKFAQEVASSDRYRAAAGNVGQRYVQEYLTKMARKGSAGAHHTIRLIDMLRKNMGVGSLGFNPQTILVQFSSLVDGFGMIGPGWGAKGVVEVFTKEGRDFVKANMPEVMDRLGGDWSFAGTSWLEKKAFKGIGMTDEITAGTVALGAYAKKVHDLGLEMDYTKPNQEAIEYAQLIVSRTQASGAFWHRPMMIDKYGSISKALFQFQTFPINKFWYMYNDGIAQAVKHGNWKNAATVLFWAQAAFLAEQGIRLGYQAMIGSGGGDDDKDTAEKIASNILWDNLQSVPIVGAISRSARYGSTPVPILAIPSDLGKGIKSATTGKTEETRIRGAIRAGASVAQAAGIPGVAPASKVIRSQIKSDPEEVSYQIKDSAKRIGRDTGRGAVFNAAAKLRSDLIKEGVLPKNKDGKYESIGSFQRRYEKAWEKLMDR